MLKMFRREMFLSGVDSSALTSPIHCSLEEFILLEQCRCRVGTELYLSVPASGCFSCGGFSQMMTQSSMSGFVYSDRQSLGRSSLPDRELAPAREVCLRCEECQTPLWRAGEVVPAGTYVRVDDRSYRAVMLDQEGPLPATFDGHIALYCTSACACRDHAHRSSGE